MANKYHAAKTVDLSGTVKRLSTVARVSDSVASDFGNKGYMKGGPNPAANQKIYARAKKKGSQALEDIKTVKKLEKKFNK